MAKTKFRLKFKLNRSGVRELLRSEEMQAECMEYADAALQRLGEGYSANVRIGKSRVNVEVKADTYRARRENLKTNSILKAL